MLRKIASLTLVLAGICDLVTCIVLYITPQGRIAYWADWRLWGLTKTQWGNLHVNLGILIILAGGLHIYYNWSVILSYLKNKARQLKVFSRAFNIALALTVIFIAGTYFEVPPLIWVPEISDSIKDAAAEKYGDPPYGHAELSSLRIFAENMELNLEKSKKLLEKAGIYCRNEEQSLQEIAKLNNVSPQQIYHTMKPAGRRTGSSRGPGAMHTPPQGIGRRSLSDICRQYDLDTHETLQALARENIKAEPGMKIKEIAEANGKSPRDIYEIIIKIAKTP